MKHTKLLFSICTFLRLVLITNFFFIASSKIKAQPNSLFNNPIRNDKNLITTKNFQSAITKTGQWGWGSCLAVQVKGNYAFIGNGALFQAFDVSNPTNPQPVGQLLTDGLVSKIIVSGNYAYTLSPFRIIDISNVSNPNLITTLQLPTSYPAVAITVNGDLAFVGDSYGNIFIINVLNPSQPTLLNKVGSMLTSGEVINSMAVFGNYLYVTCADINTIDIFNISNPTNPFKYNQFIFNGVGSSLAVKDSLLYLGTTANPQLQVYSIIQPIPQYITGINLITAPSSISVVDTLLYISLENNDFMVINIANKTNAYVLNTLPPHNSQISLYGGGFQNTVSIGTAYIASGNGLWIVDISNLPKLNTDSFFITSSTPLKIVIDSTNHAFIATLSTGLKIIDYSNPFSPQYVNQFFPDEGVRDVVVGNNIAYLLCDSDLILLDISNLRLLKVLSKIQFSDTLNDNGSPSYGCLFLSGTTIFASRNSGKLYDIDVATPTKPKIRSVVPTNGVSISISKVGNYLYVADDFQGIQVFNVSTPDSLSQYNFISKKDLVGFCIEDNMIFLLDDNGFSAYQISDSLILTKKYSLSIPLGITTDNLTLENNFIYVVYGETFLVVDISNPDSGKIIFTTKATNLDVSDFGEGTIAVLNGTILLGAGWNGILILKNNFITDILSYDLIQPKEFTLYQNYPNPFNPSTTIKYSVSEGSNIILKVFDIIGRKIETLINRYQQPGIYTIKFSNYNLPSGIYIYSLSSREQTIIKKMIILK